MAKVAYIRVSTANQNTARQDVGDVDKVFEEKVSGKNVKDRQALQDMIEYVREGDEVIACTAVNSGAFEGAIEGDAVNTFGAGGAGIGEGLREEQRVVAFVAPEGATSDDLGDIQGVFTFTANE